MTRKVKSWKSDTIPPQAMILRMVEIRRETASPADKSVEVVIATETPVMRWDEQRGASVAEILSMDGVTFRRADKQLPIIDSHNRSTVRNVLGSVRNIHVDGTALVGTASFARDDDSQEAYQKLLDGHLTDFSITATPDQVRTIRRDETYEHNGQTIQGPADIVTRWTPTDASLVAAGADVNSTVRELMRSYTDPARKVKRMMTDEMKAALVAQGMPEQLASPEEALAWAAGVIGTLKNPATPAAEAPAAPPIQAAEEATEPTPKKEGDDMDDSKKTEEAVERALVADRNRRNEINALCDKANLERSFADELCNNFTDIGAARAKVLERMIEKQKPAGSSAGTERIEFGASSDDKFNAALGDALIQRACMASGSRRDPFNGQKAADGAEDFRNMGLMRMAEESLRRAQINTARMSARDIAMIALGDTATMYRHNIRRDAYHTTGSFANLMMSASNKTLLNGYEEAEITWNRWARQAASTPDFKAINRIRFSESPNLLMVPENHDYPEGTMSDSKESYKPEKFGRMFTVSWETIVNDDLDAISRIPAMHGAAARRTQNAKVYEVLTANAAMSDGVALFHSTHANHAGAAAAPSVTTLNAGFLAMRKQTGLNSSVVLNITPSFLIVPAAYEATALALQASLADPAAGGSAVGNSNNANLYGPTGSRRLTVIADPVLDGNSATNWYLAANSSQVDTVELTFLQGEESPVLDTDWKLENDVYTFRIRQTFGVKAIDWRGLYLNAA